MSDQAPVTGRQIHARFVASWLLVLGIFAAPSAGRADAELDIPEASGLPEAWLVTYGPGDIYWQRFGHNAIWLRDPERGLDHAFNFGFFDFGQADFLQRFVAGRMLYFSAAQPSAREFSQYQRENRTVRARKLQLQPEQYARLREHLVRQVQPEHRDYLYDYYLDNCSTRIRDALDVALGGNFARANMARPAEQNFRDHTRRSVAADFWYYLGLETALALPVDRNINAWQEMFLPEKVTEAVAEFQTRHGPLAGAEHVIFRSDASLPPDQPPSIWWRYLAAGLGLALLFMLLGRMVGPVMLGGSALGWLLLAGTGGILLSLLWLFTDHQATGPNLNLLLLNPLFLLGLWPGLRRLSGWLMLVGLGLGMLQGLFPAAQYNLDVVAFLAPLNGACAGWLLRFQAGLSPHISPRRT